MQKKSILIFLSLVVFSTLLLITYTSTTSSSAIEESWHDTLISARLDCEDDELKKNDEMSCWNEGPFISSNKEIKHCFNMLERCARNRFNQYRKETKKVQSFKGFESWKKGLLKVGVKVKALGFGLGAKVSVGGFKPTLVIKKQTRIEGGDSRPWRVIAKDCFKDCDAQEVKNAKSAKTRPCWSSTIKNASKKHIWKCYLNEIHCVKKCFNLAWKDKTKRKSPVF